ncbi:ABC transporter substrate-binding protein [Cobetia sp. QF-1]|uniref:ABC transporter substrate-binding protein n=1 Tax=Cobetia sp. QF-1 TaxID=1969833 RepID=UPI0020CE2F8E|nr:ABC transporter substrate-binding protein [Cobetia sp. QF-1]
MHKRKPGQRLTVQLVMNLLTRLLMRLLISLLVGGMGISTASAASRLVIEAALDQQVATPLLTAFSQQHPEFEIDYRDRTSMGVHALAEQTAPGADIIISSAMPWQVALVNQGLAQRLDSDVARRWPAWAKWRNEVFAFTFEPIVMAYRLDLAGKMLPPSSHADVLRLLTEHADTLSGRVAAYSPSRSALGYVLYLQDSRYSGRFWSLVEALGRVNATLETSTQRILEGLSEGRYWLGYNLLGSYALQWAQSHPEVIVQMPSDYALISMRTAFIHRDAPHPQAARTFLNFLLSRAGQHVLAGETPLFSIRSDVVGPFTAQSLRDQVGQRLYPQPLDASSLSMLDGSRRADFLTRWFNAYSGGAPTP